MPDLIPHETDPKLVYDLVACPVCHQHGGIAGGKITEIGDQCVLELTCRNPECRAAHRGIYPTEQLATGEAHEATVRGLAAKYGVSLVVRPAPPSPSTDETK